MEESINDLDIRKLIVNSDDFSEKYTKIVNDIYKAILGEQPSEDVIKHYLHKLAVEPDFDINVLCKELRDIPVDNQTIDIKETMDYGIVNNFENTFGRCMTVHEFMKYNDWNLSPETLLKFHTSNVDVANTTCQLYMKENVDQLTFMRKILPGLSMQSDNQLYIRGTLKELIKNDVRYRNKLVERLECIHRDLYDTLLSDDDIAYMFEKARDAFINLYDEGASDIVKQVKRETEEFSEVIDNVFQLQLERSPDCQEISDYVQAFRRGEMTKDLLQAELVRSLEFLDVVKRHIQCIESQPSKIYKLLKHIMLKAPDSLEKADDLITKMSTAL
jgi:bacterioferritin (cytochrome b1)